MNLTSPTLHRVRARQARHLPWLALVTALLSACGGGGSDAGDPNFGTPTVTAVTADRVSYGQVSTFTVTGTHLTTSTDFSVTGCDNLAVLRDSTTQHRVTCTPDEAMAVRFTAGTGSTTLFERTYTVPKPQVTMTTSKGTLVVELEPAKVPITVANFLGYVHSGFYNGTIFHRVITVPLTGIAVDQGGAFTGVSGTTLVAKSGVGAAITLETNRGLSNLRGSHCHGPHRGSEFGHGAVLLQRGGQHRAGLPQCSIAWLCGVRQRGQRRRRARRHQCGGHPHRGRLCRRAGH